MSQFDLRELRDAFGSFMTGVTIVTAVSRTGEKVGFTANSFTSVSMEPPLLLVCPANRLSSFKVFEACEHFAVSILAEDQQDASNTFAGSKGDRFSEIEWHRDAFGTPLINDAVAHFSCSAYQKIPAGDHLLLLGQVESFQCNEKLGLGYAKGGYFSLGMEHQAEALTHEQSARLGCLVECEGRLLVKKTEHGLTLPQTSMTPRKSSLMCLKAYLDDLNLDAEIGQVFSIYERSETGNFIAFYRAEVVKQHAPQGYQFIPIEQLVADDFVSSDVAAMVTRFIQEKRHGVFRLYVGNEIEGYVR
jgi:flavin reductase (DIM6/NTAB) family NADH-FMN oxidoreductase RutF